MRFFEAISSGFSVGKAGFADVLGLFDLRKSYLPVLNKFQFHKETAIFLQDNYAYSANTSVILIITSKKIS